LKDEQKADNPGIQGNASAERRKNRRCRQGSLLLVKNEPGFGFLSRRKNLNGEKY